MPITQDGMHYCGGICCVDSRPINANIHQDEYIAMDYDFGVYDVNTGTTINVANGEPIRLLTDPFPWTETTANPAERVPPEEGVLLPQVEEEYTVGKRPPIHERKNKLEKSKDSTRIRCPCGRTDCWFPCSMLG